jgi:predicted AlkP superfamily phosphohydrolase/phosphomutase
VTATGKTGLLVFGLDGVPWNLLAKWIEEERLPTLGQLKRDGSSGILESAVPIGTPTSWSSIITGTNPGKHGIYEFMCRKAGSYEFAPVDSGRRKAESVWDILSREGRRVGVFNVPITYPPGVVNGIIVSGLLTPEGRRDFAYPPNLVSDIYRAFPNYRIHPKFKFQEKRESQYLTELMDLISIREKVLLKLLEDDWDFFMTVFTESDAVQHAFWQYFDRDHPNWRSENESFEGAIFAVFERLDKTIGRAISASGNPTIIVLSDHGNGPLHTFVHLNNFLIQNRFLKLKPRLTTRLRRVLYSLGLSPLEVYEFLASRNILNFSDAEISAISSSASLASKLFLSYNDIDWRKSKAYGAMGFGQVFINLIGREPVGAVEANAKEQIIADITETIKRYRDPRNGKYVFAQVFRKDQLYQGNALESAPDLVLIPRPGYAVFPQYSFAHHGVLSRARGISSAHTREGIVLMHGPKIERQSFRGASVVDIAPTILSFFGLEADWMDGKPLVEFGKFKKGVARIAAIRETGPTFTSTEENELVQHLKDLGYA